MSGPKIGGRSLLHPNMAGYYRAQVANLTKALNAEENRAEAADLIRSLVDRITPLVEMPANPHPSGSAKPGDRAAGRSSCIGRTGRTDHLVVTCPQF